MIWDKSLSVYERALGRAMIKAVPIIWHKLGKDRPVSKTPAEEILEAVHMMVKEKKMNELKLEVGKWYETRNGKKAFVAFEYRSRNGFTHHGYVKEGDFDDTISWHSDGVHYRAERTNYDLIEEWKEPLKGEGWMNVYKNTYGDVWYGVVSRDVEKVKAWEAQEKTKGETILARIKISWTEGQFDD